MHGKKFLPLWTLMSFFVSTSPKQIPKIGPYTFIMRERAECDDGGTGEIWASESAIRKTSRTTIQFAGRIHSNITIDDSVEIHVNNAIWGNGGWKRNSLTYNHGPACTVVKTLYKDLYDEVAPQMMRQLNVTDCPIPGPASLFITISLNTTRFLQASTYIPHLPYGRYKAEMTAVKDGEIKGCDAAIVDIVPRRLKEKS